MGNSILTVKTLTKLYEKTLPHNLLEELRKCKLPKEKYFESLLHFDTYTKSPSHDNLLIKSLITIGCKPTLKDSVLLRHAIVHNDMDLFNILNDRTKCRPISQYTQFYSNNELLVMAITYSRFDMITIICKWSKNNDDHKFKPLLYALKRIKYNNTFSSVIVPALLENGFTIGYFFAEQINYNYIWEVALKFSFTKILQMCIDQGYDFNKWGDGGITSWLWGSLVDSGLSQCSVESFKFLYTHPKFNKKYDFDGLINRTILTDDYTKMKILFDDPSRPIDLTLDGMCLLEYSSRFKKCHDVLRCVKQKRFNILVTYTNLFQSLAHIINDYT